MKATIAVRDLRLALDGLSRVVSRRSTLPVLRSIQIARHGQDLLLEGTDLDQQLQCQVPAYIDGDDPFLVDLEQLRTLVAHAEGNSVVLESGKEHLQLTREVAGQLVAESCPLLDPKEWPKLPPGGKTQPVDAAFLEQFRRVSAFVSHDESRRTLTGVYLDVSESCHYLIATDGRRLTAVNSLKYPIAASCVIPTTRFLTWSKLHGDPAIGLTTTGWFKLALGPWTYLVRTVEGAYPNWRQVVPDAKAAAHRILVGEADVELISKALGSIKRSDSTVYLDAKAGQVQLAYQGESKDWSSIELPTSRGEGQAGGIAANRCFLLDALAAGFRNLGFQDPVSPILGTDGQGALHVLMPIRIDQPPRLKNPVHVLNQPTRKEEPMKNETPAAQEQPNALDRVLAAYETAKTKVREANDALAVIAAAVKDALKEDKQRRAEIESVRTGLARLQSIKV